MRKLYHVTVVLLSGEERVYTRFGSWRAIQLCRHWRKRTVASVSMRSVSAEERQPVCDEEGAF